MTPQKALIQLSVRGLSDDKLWFDFFHECFHVVKHQRRHVFVEGLDRESQEEMDADQFACDQLLPRPAWDEFTAARNFSSQGVSDLAIRVRVTPGVVVGRLQHERLIAFSALNHLKVRLKWGTEEDD